MLIYGINPVLEAIRAKRVSEIRVAERAGGRMSEVLAAAERSRIPVRRVGAPDLDRAARGGVHQGVIAELREPSAPLDVPGLLAASEGPPLIVVLDGVEDPHNFGAILRTADAAGATGVIRQTRHAAPLSGATAKASAGALAHVRIADVVNIARAIEELKEAGVWAVGFAGDGSQAYDAIDYTLPTALVVGAEGTGLRRLVRERCDWLVSIPMQGHVQSLNVSVAAGIALFEALRQRRAKVPGH